MNTAGDERWQRPGTIGPLRLPHRLVMGSMHLNLEARPEDAAALAAFYAERARGGAGLIVTGGSAVSRVGAGGRGYGFVNEEPYWPALRRVATEVHREGGLIALQLFHAGRYAFESAFGLRPLAPSAVYSRFSGVEPAEMTPDQIQQAISEFAEGAARARELGFDAVEVMASEGYLIDQFLSPLTNQRQDAWGGDSERRTRFGVAVLRAVRAAVGPEFPVIVRISGADLMPDSTSPDEVAGFARALVAAGVDALNVGIGWHEATVPTVQTLVPPGVWTRYALAVKQAVGDLPVIAGNRVNRLDVAERLLAEGLDFVSMARPFLADPRLVAKGLSGRPELINTCVGCDEACIDRSIGEEPVSCMVNPRAGREHELAASEPGPAKPGTGRRGWRSRRFAVLGGGPAGLEAARELASLGQRVELFEAAGELGGQFRYARQVPGKADFGETIRYFEHELADRGVVVRLSRPVGAGDESMMAEFDGVVLATGVMPRRVDLPGVDLPHVLDYQTAFEAAARGELGARVAIIGAGGIGVDLAHLLSSPPPPAGSEDPLAADWRHFLVEQGLAEVADADQDGRVVSSPRSVTLLRRHGRIGAGIGRSTRWAVLAELRRHGVRMLRSVRYLGVETTGLLIRHEDGREELVEADTVVVAAGQQPRAGVRHVLDAAGVPYLIAGGARDARELNAVRAFEQGLYAARELVGGTAPTVRATPVEASSSGG